MEVARPQGSFTMRTRELLPMHEDGGPATGAGREAGAGEAPRHGDSLSGGRPAARGGRPAVERGERSEETERREKMLTSGSHCHVASTSAKPPDGKK